VRWKGQGKIRSGDYTVYYSGGERAEKGVAIVVHKSVVRSVAKKIVYDDRIIAIKLQAEPINILMIQVYMPTSEHEDDEDEELYGVIKEILEEYGKGNTKTIIMWDWNSVVGDEPYRNIVGPHGLGRNNHRGQMLINCCERNGLSVTNTRFRKPKRRLYTWKAPGHRSRHQLDYILVKHRFRNSVKDVQTMPGADIYSDHKSLVGKICTRLKKIIKFQKKTTMGFGEIVYSKTNSAGYSRKETRYN
jgi:exonuclease III